MDLVMCRSCGHFVQALRGDDGLVPMMDVCPECGATSFRDNHADRVISSGDD